MKRNFSSGVFVVLALLGSAALNAQQLAATEPGGVAVPSEPTVEYSPYSSTNARYVPGKGYFVTRENVALRVFRRELANRLSTLTTAGTGASAINLTNPDASKDEVLEAALAVMKSSYSSKSDPNFQSTASGTGGEVMFMAIPTPSAVTTTLISVELMLDDLLNRANSGVSSALFSMRSHVAASESDLNVIFKKRMDESFDRLSEQEQKILTQAMVLASNAESTIAKVEKEGFERAADLVCETTAGFANYSIGLPIGRLLPPDLLCLKEQDIRDVGPQREQLLTFRGVNLQPKEEYPVVKITVAGQELKTITGGGNSILQMALAGGLNGAPNDTSLRGDRIAEAEFTWNKSNRTRRWLFVLQPYLVRTLDAKMTPSIKGPVRKLKTQSCYLKAAGGSLGSREEYGTCTILVDDGWEMESCSESGATTSNGDAGIRNRLFSIGACQWEMRAKSKSLFGAGAWYGFEGRATMKRFTTIAGRPYIERKVVNQNSTGEKFEYPANEYVPPEYQILQGDWSWSLDYVDNTSKKHTLTNSQPSAPGIGLGSLLSNVLTYTVKP